MKLLASSFVALAFASSLSASLMGCAADTSEPTASESQDDLKVGAFCGGIAGVRCKTGLHCQLSSNLPDASGSCVKDDGTGAFCGGIANIQCKSGLQCKLTSNFPDAGGACVKPIAQCKAIALCTQGKHWDADACACVQEPNAQCHIIMQCVKGKKWDGAACACK